MSLGVEVTEMGWDLSLRAQSRKTLAMNNVWLREEEEDWGWNKEAIQVLGPKTRDSRSLGQNRNIDPILGFNLEGQSSIFKKDDFSYTLMDHDIQDRVLTVEEGKKRARGRVKTGVNRGGREEESKGESEDGLAKEENSNLA
ncbi:hypothetical protein GOBAR_DD08972 [Gossypium barbadense]|nr:hypothetical protein GOBAR_DD08972 [Gossypium barbadense]